MRHCGHRQRLHQATHLEEVKVVGGVVEAHTIAKHAHVAGIDGGSEGVLQVDGRDGHRGGASSCDGLAEEADVLGLIASQQAGKGGGDVCSKAKWTLLPPVAVRAIRAARKGKATGLVKIRCRRAQPFRHSLELKVFCVQPVGVGPPPVRLAGNP